MPKLHSLITDFSERRKALGQSKYFLNKFAKGGTEMDKLYAEISAESQNILIKAITDVKNASIIEPKDFVKLIRALQRILLEVIAEYYSVFDTTDIDTGNDIVMPRVLLCVEFDPKIDALIIEASKTVDSYINKLEFYYKANISESADLS